MQARHTNVVQTMAQVVLCLCKQETEFPIHHPATGSVGAAGVTQGGQPDGHGNPVLPRPLLHVPHFHAHAHPSTHTAL